jgi:spermidine synthase
VARRSFWCIDTTLQAAGFITLPYHCYVPSFGEWGYVLASPNYSLRFDGSYPKGLKFINKDIFRQMLVFPPDMSRVSTSINRLNNHALVHYFESDWGPYSN